MYGQSIELYGSVKESSFNNSQFPSGKQYIDFNFTLITDNGVELKAKKRFFNVNEHSINDAKGFIKHQYSSCKKVVNLQTRVKITSEGTFNGFSEFNNKITLTVDDLEILNDSSVENANKIIIKMIVENKQDNIIYLNSKSDKDKDIYETRLKIKLKEGIPNIAIVGQGYSFACFLKNNKQVMESEYSWDNEYVEDDFELVALPTGKVANYTNIGFKDMIKNIKQDTEQANQKINEANQAF